MGYAGIHALPLTRPWMWTISSVLCIYTTPNTSVLLAIRSRLIELYHVEVVYSKSVAAVVCLLKMIRLRIYSDNNPNAMIFLGRNECDPLFELDITNTKISCEYRNLKWLMIHCLQDVERKSHDLTADTLAQTGST